MTETDGIGETPDPAMPPGGWQPPDDQDRHPLPDSDTGGRAPRPSGGRFLRGAGVLLALLCVVVAGIGVRFTDELEFAVVTTVDIGQSTNLNGDRITVTEVELGRFLEEESSYDPARVESAGLYLVITVRLEAPRGEAEVGGLTGPMLYTDDRTYTAFGSSTAMDVPPGYVGTARMMFEVDPEHISGAYVELMENELVWQVPQKVHVRLGITDDNADTWVRTARTRVLDADQGVQLKAMP